MGGGISISQAAKTNANAKKLFHEIDINGDGALEIHELIAVTKKYGAEVEAEWPECIIREYMERYDKNAE